MMEAKILNNPLCKTVRHGTDEGVDLVLAARAAAEQISRDNINKIAWVICSLPPGKNFGALPTVSLAKILAYAIPSGYFRGDYEKLAHNTLEKLELKSAHTP